MIKAELEAPCARLSNKLESLGGGSRITTEEITHRDIYIIIPPMLVFTKQNITFNM
jgi:hypothetical protein